MCADASCSLSRSSGEISARKRQKMPVSHNTSLPTGAARGPPSAREIRQR